jgi:hypothetical protein
MYKYKVFVVRNAIGQRLLGISRDVLADLQRINQGESSGGRGLDTNIFWCLSWMSQEMTLEEAQRLEIEIRSEGTSGLKETSQASGCVREEIVFGMPLAKSWASAKRRGSNRLKVSGNHCQPTDNSGD